MREWLGEDFDPNAFDADPLKANVAALAKRCVRKTAAKKPRPAWYAARDLKLIALQNHSYGWNRPFADGVDGAPNGIKRAKMVVVASAFMIGPMNEW